MTENLPRAGHRKMDSRATLAREFFEVTRAEVTPFVSDEATWYDFDYLEPDELGEVIQAHYGVALDHAKLAMPFWAFLDYLNVHREHGTG